MKDKTRARMKDFRQGLELGGPRFISCWRQAIVKIRKTGWWFAGGAIGLVTANLVYPHINWDLLLNRSGPAEWLSALLNVVMAVAAVAAFITARSWLPQLTTQEGYKLAIALVNEEFIWLGLQNRLLPDTAALITAAEQLFLASGNYNQQFFAQATDGLKKTILDNKDRLDRIDIAMFQMQTYGLQVSGNKAASMNAMLKTFRESVSGASAVFQAITQYDGLRQEELKKPTSLTTPEDRAIRKQNMKINDQAALHKAREHFQLLKKSWESMVINQGYFTGDDHRIARLFIVRKD